MILNKLISIVLCFVISSLAYGQLNEENIDIKVKFLDNLYANNEMDSVELQDLHACGGITGYYFNEKLNLIKSVSNAEAGSITEFYYFSRGTLIKVVRSEHVPEWDKHFKNYPEEAKNNKFDHMTFKDSTFETYFTDKVVTYSIVSGNKVLHRSNVRLIKELNWCVKELIPLIELDYTLDYQNTKKIFEIDHSINSGRTKLISYSEKSKCGGSLKGYYRNDSLIKLVGINGGELESFEMKEVYFVNDYPIRMIYQQHFPDWDSFEETTQNSNNDFEQLNYSDTTYHIEFYSNYTPIYKVYDGHFEVINDTQRASVFIECVFSMIEELSKERR